MLVHLLAKIAEQLRVSPGQRDLRGLVQCCSDLAILYAGAAGSYRCESECF